MLCFTVLLALSPFVLALPGRDPDARAVGSVPWWARPGPAGELDAHGIDRGLYTAGEVVVGHLPGRAAECEAALGLLGARVVQRAQGLDFLRVRLVEGMQPSEAIELFAGLPGVAGVARNAVLTPCSVPDDPLYHLQYDARLIGIERVWGLTTGSSNVIVAVCDSGIASDLDDLQGVLVPGTNTSLFSDGTEDVYGHGTAMASIIGARRNNGLMGSGLAPGCRLMPVKVSSDQGLTTTFEVAAGIQWAADNGARVILVALASPLTEPMLGNAVQHAFNRNCVVVASAGNVSTTLQQYPAAIPGVIGVAGSNYDDTRLAESNHGGWVSIAAPAKGLVYSPDGFVGVTTGTSTAAARVAAGAALLFSHLGTSTSHNTIRGRLVGHADPVPGNWVLGRLNLYDALVNQASTVVSNDFPTEAMDGQYGFSTLQWHLMYQNSPDERFRVDGSSAGLKKKTVLSLPLRIPTSPRGLVQWFEVAIEARSPTSTPVDVSIWDFQSQTWVKMGTMALGPLQDKVTVYSAVDWADRFYSDDELREVHVRLDAVVLGKYEALPLTVEIDSLRVITRAKL